MRGAPGCGIDCAMVRPMLFAPGLPVLVGVALAAPVTAPLSPPIETVGYETAVTTRVFEVLDVDHAGGRVLFRHVFIPLVDDTHGMRTVVDCAYPSLGPWESEVVGIYDTGRDAFDTVFVVHPPAESFDSCATADEIKETRAALTAAALHAGLSLEKRPVAIGPTPRGDAFVVMMDGKPGRVRIETRRARADEVTTTDGASAVALGRLYLGDVVLYERLQPLEDTRSVGREIDFLALFVDGKRAIALERFSHRPDGGTPRTLFRFSRVLDLTGAPLPTADDARAAPSAPPSDDDGAGSCCGGNPFLSCGLFACVAPLLSGCVCASCCLSMCDPDEWRNFFDDEDTPPPEEEEPREQGPGQDQVARMRY
jgi:hypothetical protein